jgi:hypothetical protein
MNCPTEIAQILTRLLTTALLRIRALGWSGNAQRCAIESDHVHNLPDLLAQYSPERLVYYWEIERTAYMSQSADSELESWKPLWAQLKLHLESAAGSSATRKR